VLVDCFIVTNHGLFKVSFDSDDLMRIKRTAEEMCGNVIIDFNIHLENGRTRNVQARPNYILMKMCGRGGVTN